MSDATDKFIKSGQTLVFLVIIYLCCSCHAAGFGRCPKYPSMAKFKMSRILGKWYEVERSFYLPEIASGCTTFDFEIEVPQEVFEDENFRLKVTIKTINLLTGGLSVKRGSAIPENSKSSIVDFKFNSRFPDVIARLLPGSGKYQFLYTDYDNFLVLWSCSSFGSLSYADQLWILGRRRDFSPEVRSNIYKSLKVLSLDPDRLTLSNNKNCPSYL